MSGEMKDAVERANVALANAIVFLRARTKDHTDTSQPSIPVHYIRTILAALSQATEENERLTREAEGRMRADAAYRKRWREDAKMVTVDEIRRHLAGLRPGWAEALAEMQSRVFGAEDDLAALTDRAANAEAALAAAEEREAILQQAVLDRCKERDEALEYAPIVDELQHIRVGMLDLHQAAAILERLVGKAQALPITAARALKETRHAE